MTPTRACLLRFLGFLLLEKTRPQLLPFRRRLVIEVFPLHGLPQRLDAEHDFAALEQAHGAARLADDDGQGGGGFADGGPGPVAGAEPLG